MTTARNDLELIALTKRYGDATAVAGIDLRIAGGSYCCLLGPSGCGKTSTLRMIAGHEVPTEGHVLLSGREITPLSEATAQLKASIYAGQASALLQKAISDEARKLGVHVSPRYGRWDPTTQAVLAVKSPVSLPN